MEDYFKRVLAEKEELDAKHERLKAFINGEMFKGLEEREQDRLRRQSVAMGIYSSVLGERVKAHTDYGY